MAVDIVKIVNKNHHSFKSEKFKHIYFKNLLEQGRNFIWKGSFFVKKETMYVEFYRGLKFQWNVFIKAKLSQLLIGWFLIVGLFKWCLLKVGNSVAWIHIDHVLYCVYASVEYMPSCECAGCVLGQVWFFSFSLSAGPLCLSAPSIILELSMCNNSISLLMLCLSKGWLLSQRCVWPFFLTPVLNVSLSGLILSFCPCLTAFVQSSYHPGFCNNFLMGLTDSWFLFFCLLP